MTVEQLFAGELRLVEEGEFAKITSMSLASIAKAVSDGSLFCVWRDGQMHYPSFFVDQRFDRRQLTAVCKRLGDLPGSSKWQFFSTPKGSLEGLTPLEALLEGRLAMVKRSAAGFRER